METKKNYTYRQCGMHYVLSIANHADLAAAIQAFCDDQDVKAGSIVGIGAVNRATLRFFDPATKQYVDKTFEGQMEIANLTGNISAMGGKPYIHLHCVLGLADYTARAGHLLTATLSGAGEFVVTTFDAPIERRHDEETGLNMYDF